MAQAYLGTTELNKLYLGTTQINDVILSTRFAPELVPNLYYWWDFTDSGTMTFSAGTTIATISNKAARTSGNETLNAVGGSPYFENITSGSRFTSTDAISNTSVAGTAGDLDTLFSGNNATVIWIGNIVGFNSTVTQPSNNTLWCAAGTGIDNSSLHIVNRQSGFANSTKCATDNNADSTYQYLLSFEDYLSDTVTYYGYRTYDTNFVGTNMFAATAIDYSISGYNSVNIQRDTQNLCSVQYQTGFGRVDNIIDNRGFKINARSRAGVTFPGNQYIQHLLIYDGILTNAQISTIYNSWEGSL
jgi:hypothetical protein